ncbi:MAG TPA: efflux transporter outer membrane subunit [Steroidobacteraceae bacterium]|nr:efflux transporter outer membrane subunit [Steroidobacteraceae bacterium]
MSLCLGACKMGPNFAPPNEPVPDQYAAATGKAPGADAVRPTSATPPDSNWWHQFHDAQLDQLEEQAAAGNLTLKASYLRILEARIQVQVARAQGLPNLNGSASYTREQLGLAGIVKSQGLAAGSAPPAVQELISSLEKPVNIYQLGFDASWELDLFGKVRRAVEAADAQSTQAVESKNDLLVSLEAEVAETYFQLRSGQMLRQMVNALISAQSEVVELTMSRQRHGLGSEADLQTARAQLASLQSQLPQYEQAVASSRHALAVLCGKPPEAFDDDFGATGELPALPQMVAIGVPSSLARRRPDIRNAEAALHAATAQVGVSVASFFPQISLSGTLGLRNTDTRFLFDWASKFYSAGPGISVPIFQGGTLVANVRLSRAEAAAAALSYRHTVLSALQEVEDGLISLREDSRRRTALQDSVAADQRALDINLDAYRHGLVPYVTVLTLQLQTVQARQQMTQALLTQNLDLVKLYKALGGGWESAAAATTAPFRGSADSRPRARP